MEGGAVEQARRSQGKPDPALVALLEKEKRTDSFESGLDYTIGFLHETTKNTEEAPRALASALQVEDWALMDAQAWVLQGMIQEQYGNVEAAQGAYADARRRPVDRDQASWALLLAPKL